VRAAVGVVVAITKIEKGLKRITNKQGAM